MYAHSKVAAERLVGAYAQQAPTRTTIARLFNVYGSGATVPHVVPEILLQLKHGDDLHLGNLETIRDYLHVSDAVDGLITVDAWAARTFATTTSVLNVGSGQGRTVRDIVTTLAKVTGRPLRAARDESKVRLNEPLALVADVSKSDRIPDGRLPCRSMPDFVGCSTPSELNLVTSPAALSDNVVQFAEIPLSLQAKIPFEPHLIDVPATQQSGLKCASYWKRWPRPTSSSDHVDTTT